MQNNTITSVERIIAKIDNDFNPDNSDWIPRVAAWCIDAMSMLKVLRTVDKTRKLTVKDKIAYSDCPIDNNIKVYDENGCEVTKANDNASVCQSCPSTGEESQGAEQSVALTPSTINIDSHGEPADYVIAEYTNTKDYLSRYNVKNYSYGSSNTEHNYVIVDCNKLELNFDADYITIKYKTIETQSSSMYGCELPVIPNNGLLIEAITYYCMYKMLCRGYKHPVMNLAASQYGTNPYYQWLQLKDKAETSVTIDSQGDSVDDNGLWQEAFYINTFNPRG